MGILSVIAAAVAAWLFGAVWYMVLSERWLEAQGLTTEEIDRRSPLPHVVGFLCLLLVAGMMRHMFGMAGIETVGKGLVSGLGLGAFIAAPWLVMNVLYSGRSKALIWIDGGYAVIGCTIVGTVLTLF